MINSAAQFKKTIGTKYTVQAAIDAFLAQGGAVTVVKAVAAPKQATAKWLTMQWQGLLLQGLLLAAFFFVL